MPEPHVKFMPSGARCPECGSPAMRKRAGIGDYWTELYKGQMYTCTRCGLEFPFEPRTPQPKTAYRKSAEDKAIEDTLASVERGKPVDILNLQRSVKLLKREYYKPEEKPIVGPPPKIKKRPEKWHWNIPIMYAEQAGELAGILENEGFVVTHEEVEDPKTRWAYFSITAYTKEAYEREKRSAIAEPVLEMPTPISSEELAKKFVATSPVVEIVKEELICPRCRNVYPVGSKVIKTKGVKTCPLDGIALESTATSSVKPLTERPSATTNVAGQEAPPVSPNLVVLPDDRYCTRCKTQYKAGEKVLKIAGYLLCPKEGGYLEKS